MGWQDQGLVYDIAAHIGSLGAVIIYLHADLKMIVTAGFKSLVHKAHSHDSRLFWYLIIATAPIAGGGYLLHDIAATWFRNPFIIAMASIVFGLLLWWADVTAARIRNIEKITLRDALIIGGAQVLAIIPGTSRSGITMTAGLMLGLERKSAARFSFLLAVPTIILAGGYETLKYFLQATATDWDAFFTMIIVSGVSALLTIHYFLKFLEQTGMLPYVVYRVLLGGVLIYVFV